MDKYGSSPGSSQESYFDDGPSTTPKDKQADGDQEEGLLPKSLMAGKDFKPGQEIVLEITGVQEKTFSVRYASEKGDKAKDESSDMPEKETADMGDGGGSESESMMY